MTTENQKLKDFVIENYNKVKKAKKVSPKKIWIYKNADKIYSLEHHNLNPNEGTLYDLYQGYQEKKVAVATPLDTVEIGIKSRENTETINSTGNCIIIGSVIDAIPEEQQVKANEESISISPITIINDNYNSILEFQLKWLPFVKEALRIVFEGDEFRYEEMDEDFKQLISKQDFECLVLYTKI